VLFAALAFVVIASCYDGDTCTTTTGERVRLACIDTPELRGKSAEPVAARAARDHLSGLVVGKKVRIRRITEDRYGRTVAELFLGTTNVQQEMVVSGHAEIYWRYADQCPWTEGQ
jgi:endonuclease YncB( thermonuclease family)